MNLNGKYIGLVDISRYVVILGFFREMIPIGCMYICTCMLVGTCVCVEIDRIVEADRSPGSALAKLETQEAGGVAPLQVQKAQEPEKPMV